MGISSYLHIGSAILVIILGAVIWQRNHVIDSLEHDITVARRDIALYEEMRKSANTMIDKQNSSIKQFQIDKDNYEAVIRSKEQALANVRSAKQIDIAKELAKDSSCPNQLKMIQDILTEGFRSTQ